MHLPLVCTGPQEFSQIIHSVHTPYVAFLSYVNWCQLLRTNIGPYPLTRFHYNTIGTMYINYHNYELRILPCYVKLMRLTPYSQDVKMDKLRVIFLLSFH